MPRVFRRILPLFIAILLTCATATFALAHAKPVSANVNPNAVVTTAPAKITLTFGEETDTKLTKIGVTDASGKAVDKGDTTVDFTDPKTASVSLQSNLPDGTYTVTYHTVTDDDHGIVDGKYTFTITAAGPAASGDSAASAFNAVEQPETPPATGAGGAPAGDTPPIVLFGSLLTLLVVVVVGGTIIRRRRSAR